MNLKTQTRKTLVLLLAAVVCVPAPVFAEDETPDIQPVSLDDWKTIPVYHHGRIMPMDTLAREAVEEICGSGSRVKLSLDQYYTEEQLQSKRLAKSIEIFPQGKMRKLSANEIFLSWLAEPDKWEDVPFIDCAHKSLHKILGVDSSLHAKHHRKFISPREIAQSQHLVDFFKDYEDRRQEAEGNDDFDFEPSETDKMVLDLLNRYIIYRKLTHDPRRQVVVSFPPQPGDRKELRGWLRSTHAAFSSDEPEGRSLGEIIQLLAQASDTEKQELALAYNKLETAKDRVRQAIEATELPPEPVEPIGDDEFTYGPVDPKISYSLAEAEYLVVDLRQAAVDFANTLQQRRDEYFHEDRALVPLEEEAVQPLFRRAASMAAEIEKLTRQAHLSLYDNGAFGIRPTENARDEFRHDASVYVVPALNPSALEAERDTGDEAEPWLPLAAVLHGSDALLHAERLTPDTDEDGKPEVSDLPWEYETYDAEHIRAAREAWNDLRDAFVDRTAANRAQRVDDAQSRLARTLRTLGEGIEPQRLTLLDAELPKDRQDKSLIAYTKYPAPGRLDAELRYNHLKPFTWSWVICFLAVAAFSMSFGSMKRPMLWAGVAFLALAILWSAYGFYLRIAVTHWAPVTNMYETVIFVPWVVAILAVWFVLLPLFWNGLKDGWRISAFPYIWEATPVDQRQVRLLEKPVWDIANFGMAIPRVALMGFALWELTLKPYSDGGRPVLSIFSGPATTSANDLGVWALSILFAAALIWFLPRVLLAFGGALVFVPWNLIADGNFRQRLPEIYPRRIFGLAGALGACFFFMIVSFSTIFDEDFRPLQPVLRSNFWLTIHVLTIVASYGAGLLAWVIGNIGLGHYLFGRYRKPVVAKNVPEGMRPAAGGDDPSRLAKLPPEECGTLANFAYRCVQVAVVLLAAGTILGGLWADRSWGRFWGWDPKEVWALISLLVYLAVLHGRYTGWFNNFGMIVGTIAGAMMIAFSWYGVNFILPKLSPDGNAGLHAYGSGSGGIVFVSTVVLLNCAFLAATCIRYRVETKTEVAPVEHTPELFQAPQGT